MYLKSLELSGFKSFARKSELEFSSSVTAVVGPNGSGKSNVAEAFRFVLGEQSMKSMRTKKGEDLIFNGSRVAGRMNRAKVTVTFRNENHLFPVDYSEVILSREVHRDGTNRYMVNGSQVRLKDVLELLAAARIGSSAHHIISQGEADRILSVNPAERRDMIEDALGLRIYQFKKKESERKLAKTETNLERVQTLQRETLPHLKFLEKQVKKIEKARALREELVGVAKEYFFREEEYLNRSEAGFIEDKKKEEAVLEELDGEIARKRESIEKEGDGENEEVLVLERQMRDLSREKDDILRNMGRIEGRVESEKRRLEMEARRAEKQESEEVMVPYERLADFFSNFQNGLNEILFEGDIEKVKEGVRGSLEYFRSFLQEQKHHSGEPDETQEEESEEAEDILEKLQREQHHLEEKLTEIGEKEKDQQETLARLRESAQEKRKESRGTEQEIFEKMTERTKVSARLERVKGKITSLGREREVFESDLTDFTHGISREILAYREFDMSEEAQAGMPEEDRSAQLERRRNLERKKIKVEEMGGSGEEVVSEYETLKERHEFFEREIADLEESRKSLEDLIRELETQLDTEFKEGLKEINKQFQVFFSTIFSGGKASLDLEKRTPKKVSQDEDGAQLSDSDAAEIGDDGEVKRGLLIAVTLPKKRIKGIDMLSGGERSLTSVALMFAISQVNPPPFLVLDETDAALDESNSRRYGDMLEALSERTQLIIITHNRETMSKAGTLYGITVGEDAISCVLSVKFEEASQGAAR